MNVVFVRPITNQAEKERKKKTHQPRKVNGDKDSR